MLVLYRYHVLDKMTAHSSGGAKEMEEVLAILMSLKPDVTKFGVSAFAESVVTLIA